MPDKIGGKRYNRNHESLIKDIEAHSIRKNTLIAFSRLARHDIGFSLLSTKSKCGKRIGHEIDKENVRRLQNRKSAKSGNKNTDNFAEIGRKQELNTFTNIIENTSSLCNCADNRSKVVIGKNHIRNILCNIRSGYPHTDTDIGILYRRSVIHTVSRHSSNTAAFAPCVYNTNLVLRLYTGIYRIFRHKLVKFLVAVLIDLGAGNCL